MKAKYTWQTIALVALLVAGGVLLLAFTEYEAAATGLLGLVSLVLAGARMPVVSEDGSPSQPPPKLDDVSGES